jgi:hypothetical protein
MTPANETMGKRILQVPFYMSKVRDSRLAFVLWHRDVLGQATDVEVGVCGHFGHRRTSLSWPAAKACLSLWNDALAPKTRAS